MKAIIDRFEGNLAVIELENKTTTTIPRELIPSADEGDIISITIDNKAIKKRRDSIRKLMDKVINY